MTRDFDYGALGPEKRQEIHDLLSQTTEKHINSSNGLLQPIEFDDMAHPSHKLEITHLPPSPVLEGEVQFFAESAREELYHSTRQELSRQSALTKTVRYFLDKEGVNIFPVTNHGTIEDIAIWSAAWSEHLDESTWQEQNGMIISRGVTTLGAFGMAASEVVQKAGHVFLSFPRTKTIDDLNIDNGLIEANNRSMRKQVHTWLGEDLLHKVLRHKLGKTLNVAWSGKTDKVQYGDDHQPESITMGKVGKGTLDIVKRGLVLPIVMWSGKDGRDPYVEIGGLTKVENETDAREVQRWQAESLAKAIDVPVDKIEIET